MCIPPILITCDMYNSLKLTQENILSKVLEADVAGT